MKVYFKKSLSEPVNIYNGLYSGFARKHLEQYPEVKWVGFNIENTIYWVNRKLVLEHDRLHKDQIKELATSIETITEESVDESNTPMDKQIGGDHYKTPIQAVQYIHANDIGYIEGCVIKYVTRWKKKGGIQDIDKAIHYLELLKQLEQEKGKEVKNANNS